MVYGRMTAWCCSTAVLWSHPPICARQLVYWPSLSSDITKTVSRACEICQKVLPSLEREPFMFDLSPSRGFEDISMDIFCHAGNHYIWSMPIVCLVGTWFSNLNEFKTMNFGVLTLILIFSFHLDLRPFTTHKYGFWNQTRGRSHTWMWKSSPRG
jgi:hypothetical protein